MAINLRRDVFIPLILLMTLSLSACSNDNLKDRISFCKAVVQQLLEVPVIDWESAQKKTEENSAITVHLAFNIHEKNIDLDDPKKAKLHTDRLSANCIYAYSDIAEYEVVGQEYAESPTEIYINDKMVGHFTLTKAVNAVMLNAAQGLFK
jgi:hypothetical protein